MKKYILIVAIIFGSAKIEAQIILNPNQNQTISNTSVLLEFGSQPKGILLPWVTNTAVVTGAVPGTMVYDTSDKKVKYLKAGADAGWKDLSVDVTGVVNTSLQDALTEAGSAKTIIGNEASTAPGILVLDSPTKAMVLPKVARPFNSIINPSPGMTVYDSATKQLALFNGTVWTFFNAGNIIVPTVATSTGRVWMDRNLGAAQVATSSADTASYGSLYQWGRLTDGHELRTSTGVNGTSSTDVPGNANFLTVAAAPNDWRSPQNGLFWQGSGLTGINNPCPSGFRLPTIEEFQAEVFATANAAGAFNSILKLPTAGNRQSNGSLAGANTGYYWTSSVSGANSQIFTFSAALLGIGTLTRASGASVRCIRE